MPESFNQKAGGIARKIAAPFYEKDRIARPDRFDRRRFRDPLHFLHNLFDLLAYVPDIVRVYLGKAISPRLREMIMLVVSGVNKCRA